MRRVVVTGLGLVSPLGLNVKDSWEGILAGKSGIGLIDAFDASEFPVKIHGGIKDFDITPYMSAKDARKNDEFILYGVAAAHQALDDAGLLELSDEQALRAGCAIGSGIGGLTGIENTKMVLEKSGPRRVSPFFIPSVIINMVAGMVSIKYNLKGPSISMVSACTTGTHNIGHGFRMIKYNDADVMVVGGAEMGSTPLSIAGFAAARALSTRNDEPTIASRPWDKDRDGFVLGNGAGVLVLEEYEHAKARGAHIYAEICGFGMSSDAYHITSPDPEGLGFVRVMQAALNDAGIETSSVDYVNAHGTSTPTGDVLEAMAIEKTFGKHAAKLAVSSTKSMTGHMLGAAGAAEAIFSVLAIRDQVAPPTINLDNPDEGCDLDFVAHSAQKREINVALSNSFGFGGTNGTVVFKKI